MTFADKYFRKFKYNNKYKIQEPPSGLLRFIVVIPAYLEDGILNILASIKDADKPEGDTEVIVVVNFSGNDSLVNKERNIKIHELLCQWGLNNSNDKLKFFTVLADNLPAKHAGVGLARKIGMDLAVERFGQINNENGVILSLDADARVDHNYFTVCEEKIRNNNTLGGCIYQFAHDLDEEQYSHGIYSAIVQYELHLRYYKHILDFTGFPHSHYTIGSCFGIKAGLYASHGGMNHRQAGEDFYFLNKVFPDAEFTEINNSCVFLSSRPSSRVPFGTGPVVSKLSQQPDKEYTTYNPQAFFELKQVFDAADKFYQNTISSAENITKFFAPGIRAFLADQNFLNKLEEIKRNTSSLQSFRKRFFLWFDGFKVVKYLNYVHLKQHKKIPVTEAVVKFLEEIGESVKSTEIISLLNRFRESDRKGKITSDQIL
jgi:hypothetical protein